jgi:RNA polymerase sigma factor (sigma-70 family)
MVEGDGVGDGTMRSDAELVVAAQGGERDAFGELVERWFDRCFEVAWRIVHDRGWAAEVTQETVLTAWQQLDRLRDPAAFGGWVLRSARNRALDRLARERRVVSTGEERDLEAPDTVAGGAVASPADEVERQARRDLVWAAAAALGERDASVLDLHLRHGLEPSELAEELGLSPNAAHQALFRMRARLGDAVGAWLLWRDGAPRCVVLAAELAAAGHGSFGAEVVALVRRHVDGCVGCGEERSRVTAPAAMFAAVPLLLVPFGARAEVLGELARAGVPVRAPATGTPAQTGGTPRSRPADGPPDEPGSGPAAGPTATAAGGLGRRVALLAVLAVAVVVLLLDGGFGGDGAEPAAGDGSEGGEGASGAVDAPAPPEQPAPSAAPTLLAPTLPLEQLVPPAGLRPPPTPAGGLGAPTSDTTDAADDDADLTQPGTEDPGQDADGSDTSDDPVDDPVDDPRPEDQDEEGAEEPDPVPATIESFSATLLGACPVVPGDGPRYLHEVAWATSDAITVTLDVGEGPEAVATSGARSDVCVGLDEVLTLTATGTDGTPVLSTLTPL